MSSVYLFQSCWTFSDWFSPYLMNSWSRANLSRSNRQRGVVAEYSPWTRLMRREYSSAECRCPVLDVHWWQFDVGAEPHKWARGRALVLMLERQVDTIFNLGSIIIIAITTTINIILLLIAINNIKLMLENDTHIKSHPDYPNFGSRNHDLLSTQYLFSFPKSNKNSVFLLIFFAACKKIWRPVVRLILMPPTFHIACLKRYTPTLHGYP